ncbi:outer membrane beta-barrel protein [Desulfatitalea alkaliphila]|uniref:Outer membrane beta-barrel protein n=1 Tax=Desulfatitalea alkaliphila TaxID=2929485 RepID=A0AA41R6J4_9BACT|nr:outer membrane beta-barrel protein [Desulfatitalea alkaliphila]MCJ8502120.1 outer membrane beta-barrel protein [Desulfatitalea alkaliphila]
MPNTTPKPLFLIIITIFLLMAAPTNAAQFLFTPELAAGVEYTDNLFLTPTNEVDDFITTVGLTLTGQLLGRTAGLELIYNPSYSFFADNQDLDFLRHVARVYTWKDLRRNTRLSLANDYLETENPRDTSLDFAPDDPTEGPVIGEDLTRRGRTRYRVNTTEGRLDHQYGARNTFYTALSYSFLQDIDTTPGTTVADHRIWEPALGIEHWFTQRWGVTLDGYYSHRDYVDENDRQEYNGALSLMRSFTPTLTGFVGYRHTVLYFDEPTDEDYQIYYPNAGMRYQFQENASISIAGGYLIQEFRDSDTPNEEGFVVEAALFKRWPFRSGHIELTGGSGYRIDDTGAEVRGLNIYYEGGLGLLYNLTRRISATAYGAYRYDDYPNDTPELSEQTIGAGAGIGYQALQWMNIGLTYSYRQRLSDIPTEEYTENSVMLVITMSPTRPYRWN